MSQQNRYGSGNIELVVSVAAVSEAQHFPRFECRGGPWPSLNAQAYAWFISSVHCALQAVMDAGFRVEANPLSNLSPDCNYFGNFITGKSNGYNSNQLLFACDENTTSDFYYVAYPL